MDGIHNTARRDILQAKSTTLKLLVTVLTILLKPKGYCSTHDFTISHVTVTVLLVIFAFSQRLPLGLLHLEISLLCI